LISAAALAALAALVLFAAEALFLGLLVGLMTPLPAVAFAVMAGPAAAGGIATSLLVIHMPDRFLPVFL